MGVSTDRTRKKRRGPRPVDRRYLAGRCKRCGSSLAGIFAGGALCDWCEWMLWRLENARGVVEVADARPHRLDAPFVGEVHIIRTIPTPPPIPRDRDSGVTT